LKIFSGATFDELEVLVEQLLLRNVQSLLDSWSSSRPNHIIDSKLSVGLPIQLEDEVGLDQHESLTGNINFQSIPSMVTKNVDLFTS
jgi:hypothetical protein